MKKILSFLSCIAIINTTYAQASNDEPCSAIVIPVENLGCEPSLPAYAYAIATHSAAFGNTYCNGSQNRDVWYKFTVPANGEATVAIAYYQSYNMAMELYTATSCSGPLTVANQNTQGFPCLYIQSNPSDSRTFRNLPPGSTAYLRVYKLYDINDGNGTLKICVSNTTQMADDPCTAGFFPVDPADPLGQSCTPYKTFSWTGATLTPAVPNPSCGVINPANIRDVWFKVRVPASGKLSVNFAQPGGFNTPFLAMYDATACNGTFTELYCGFFGTNLTGLTPNSIIYGRFYIYSSSAVDNGSVKLCIADFNSVPGSDNSKKVGIGIDTPFAKLDVVGTGIFRDKVMAASDLEVRGNLIVQGNIMARYNQNGGVKAGGILSVDSLLFPDRLGNHISFFNGLGSNNQYGMGIQSGLLQMYVPTATERIGFGIGNSNAFTEIMSIRGNGTVGIGINNPSGKLDIANGSAWFRGTTNISHFNLGTTEDTYVRGGKAGSKVFINDIASPGAVYIGGNVGIGNTVPDVPLAFANSVGSKIAFYSSGVSSQYGLGVQGGLLQIYSDASNSDIAFGYGGSSSFTERMRIKGNGNIGIGTNNPTKPLSFPPSLGEKILLYPGGAGEVGIGVYGNELRLHADNPGAKVSFGTQDNAGVFTENAKAERNGSFAFSVLGNLWVNGTTYTSDERFKKNISDIQSPLQKLLQLRGVEYEMNSKEFPKMYFTNGRQIGLLAQNVEKIVPEAVNEKDGYKGVDYARLVPLLIESIKEQQKKIEALEKENIEIKKILETKKGL